jgi:hypothetical protein
MLKKILLLIVSSSFVLYSSSAFSLWEEIWSPEEVSNQIDQYSEDALPNNNLTPKLNISKDMPESDQISGDSNDADKQKSEHIEQDILPNSNPTSLKKNTSYVKNDAITPKPSGKDNSMFKKINNSVKSIFDSLGNSNSAIKKQTQDAANKTLEVYKKVSDEIKGEIKKLGCEFVYKKYITEKKIPKSYSSKHNWNNWSSFDIKLYEDLIFGCKD